MLDGPAYERFFFDICNEFVICLQECFNDEHAMEVQTSEETNFHDVSCITKYEVFLFPFQLDWAVMKLVECCYQHISISDIRHGFCLFQAMPNDKVQINGECTEIKVFYDMLRNEQLCSSDVSRLFKMQHDDNYIFYRGK